MDLEVQKQLKLSGERALWGPPGPAQTFTGGKNQ